MRQPDGAVAGEIVALIDQLRAEFGLAVLVIIHDIDLVPRVATGLWAQRERASRWRLAKP